MSTEITAIFQIAGTGMVVAMLHTVLKTAGKEDWAHWVTLVGFVVVLFIVIGYVDELFEKIKQVFLLR